MTADLPSYRDSAFAIETSQDPTGIRARFVGNADMDAVTPMAALLARMHAELVRVGAREIEVDLRELEYMSTTCLKLLVNWVSDILDGPPEQRYVLRFRANPDLRWQRRSLMALQCFTTEHVVIDV